jgi:uncharacterized protein
MKVYITGGSGFVGSHMTRFLVDKGIDVTIMARNAKRGPRLPERVSVVAADATKPGEWQEAVAHTKTRSQK